MDHEIRNNEAYKLAEPEVVVEEFQEGLIVLNLSTGMYFDLGERLIPLFNYIVEGVCVADLCDALEEAETGASASTKKILKRMLEQGLFITSEPSITNIDKDIVNKILSAGQKYHFGINDDLAELIIADPIHDIDPESGKLIQ